MKKIVLFVITLSSFVNSIQAQQSFHIKLYPLSAFNNARLGLEYQYKKWALLSNTSYYYDNDSNGQGRCRGLMQQVFLKYHIATQENKYHIYFYASAGLSHMKMGIDYYFERWDYDQATGNELSYVPFSSVFGGVFKTHRIEQVNQKFFEGGLVFEYRTNNKLSFDCSIGYRYNPMPENVKNFTFENHTQFDYKWFKIHQAYSPSLNKNYHTFGIGTGVKFLFGVSYQVWKK